VYDAREESAIWCRCSRSVSAADNDDLRRSLLQRVAAARRRLQDDAGYERARAARSARSRPTSRRAIA
jgi:hypothetical protein